MIILEGPDGAGKSTLLEILQEKFALPQHARFSTSEGGPLPDVAKLAFRDVQSIHTQPLSIYNRHPLISEYAYRSAIPEMMVHDDFLEAWALNMLSAFSKASLVIFCMPPYAHIRHNILSCQACQHIHPVMSVGCNLVKSDGLLCDCTEMVYRKEMPGVVENIAAIYQMYRLLRVFWPNSQKLITYDYTDPNSIKRVFSRCQIHISEWKKAHGGN